MDKDFMLNYFNKAVQPEWEELLKTPRYQPAASKRDAIEREFFRMLNDEQKRKYLDLESAVILAECDIAEAMYNPDGTGDCVKKCLWNSKNFDIMGTGTPEPGERQEDKCT